MRLSHIYFTCDISQGVPNMLQYLWSCLSALFSPPPPLIIEEPDSKDEFDLLMERWQKDKHHKLKLVFSSDMSILRVSLSKSKIIEYRKYLELINDFFDRDATLQPAFSSPDVANIYVREFFLDGNQHYLNQYEEMDRLRDQAIAFLLHFQKGTNNVDPTFATQRNLSLTRHLVSEFDQLLMIFE